MFSLTLEADLGVCDITVHDANVSYELGIRHSLRKKGTVLIKGAPVADASPRGIDSPIFKMLLTLPELDPAAVQVLPRCIPADGLHRGGGTRKAAEFGGWLHLLASEVTGVGFQWPALRSIGKAQWQLADFVGARQAWLRFARSGATTSTPISPWHHCRPDE